MALSDLTIQELSRRLAEGETTAEEVASAALDAADDHADLNALLARPSRDALLEQARELDRRRAAGEELGRLSGVPIVVKDNICTRDLPTTAASRILEGFASPYDATVVRRLREAGALIVGKGNLDEFAMGSSNENSAYGQVKNPVDPTRVPGGSSGGSAAAVAAGLCSAALGSDTGGSIRQPASLTGVVGLKPTYGRVSRFGLIAFASSLDQIGPLTRSVGDAALMLEVIAGHDPNDMTCAHEPLPDLAPCLGSGVEGMRLGVPREYFSDEVGQGIDTGVNAAVRAAIERLADAGAEIVELSLPHTEHAVATYYLIATAEASSNLARFDGVRYGRRAEAPADLTELYERSRAEGFGDEVKRRIMLGTYVLSAGFYDAYYRKAQQVRTLIRRDFEQAFAQVDAILTPTSPSPAWKLGEKADDLLGMYLADVYTVPANLAGLPGLSVPCGRSDEGLPIGLQILGKPFDEACVLQVGAAWERLRDDNDEQEQAR